MSLDATRVPPRPAKVDLSLTPPFRLGALEVRPASREVRVPGAAVVAEPRVLQVLVALAQAQGDTVSRDVLVQRCWEGRAIGEDAIQRAVAKARRLADLTDPPAFAIESIARVGYRLKARCDGLVVDASGDNPAPGVEPGGARRRAPPTGAGLTLRRRTLVIGGAAAAAGVAVWLQPRLAKGPPRVAVLAFDNLSSDSQMGYLADGLSEDILNALTRSGGLRVIARESSFVFRGKDKAKAAGALGAAYLVDGSVLRRGDRLRVLANLTDARTDQVLWSDTYDRDMAQGFSIEDDVVSRVAAALSAQLAPLPARPADAEAYELFLRGRDAGRAHTPEAVRESQTLLRLAVQRAPNFSQGWSELSYAYWQSGFRFPASVQIRDFALGRDAARRAFGIDPRNGQAYGALAEMTPRRGAWGEVDDGLAHGLALSPNDPSLLRWRGDFLQNVGKEEAALPPLRRAYQIDPLDLFSIVKLVEGVTYVRRSAEGDALCDRLAQTFPAATGTYWTRFWLLAGSGREAQAIALLEDRMRWPSRVEDDYVMLEASLRAALSGSAAAVDAALKADLALAARGLGYAAEMISMLSRMGRLVEAARLALATFVHPDSRLADAWAFAPGGSYFRFGQADPIVLFNPLNAPLRRSGLLKPVFDGLGLTDYWRTHGGPDRSLGIPG